MSFSIATDDNFKELISEGVCIVDFCGTHCGPCRSLYPHLLEIETKVPFIHLVKTNIDICKKTAAEYMIETVPSIFLSKDGELTEILWEKPEDIMIQAANLYYGKQESEDKKTDEESQKEMATENEPKITLNPDESVVKQVREGLKAKGGYCPCRVGKKPENKCMCQEFKEQIADPDFEGFCHCKLYYKAK